MNQSFKSAYTKRLKVILPTTIGGLFTLLFSHSVFISLAFAAFIAIFLTIAQQKNNLKRMSTIEASCPEFIDALISGTQAGLSLNESLCGLAERGPEFLKPYFLEFRSNIYAHGEFESALRNAQAELAHPTTDLIFEALQISKVLGGAELITILRLLSNFIREDLTLRREIAVKHNWIRNSAHMSAAAPWVLLLLLSTQPATATAFATPTGILILVAGLALTATAYLWMNHLSKLPVANRIFNSSTELSRL